MSRKIFSIVLINAVLFCVLAELAALALYYIDSGALFYTHRRPLPLIEETQAGRLTGDALHPYFGPTHQPGVPFEIPPALGGNADGAVRATNNFGFVSPHQYPFRRTGDRQFVVGIFGGSVGVWFCELGAPRLVEELKKNVFFRDREIVPLCFSHEGYKQPQQLLLLAYFLSIGQAFDLVINIDGFNEVALGALNDQQGVDIAMPSFQHLDPLVNLIDQSTLTPEKLRSLAAIAQYKERLNALAERMQGTRVAAMHFVLARFYEKTRADYVRELGRFSNLPSNRRDRSIVRVIPKATDRDAARLFDEIAAHWANASSLMQQMLSRHETPYFHFLQPNQYYTTRRFAPGEADVAINHDSPFKSSVESGYPVLRRAGESLRERVRFFDMIAAFDHEAGSVYMDDCCHYTRAGNQTLATAIAGAILGSPGGWNPAPASR